MRGLGGLVIIPNEESDEEVDEFEEVSFMGGGAGACALVLYEKLMFSYVFVGEGDEEEVLDSEDALRWESLFVLGGGISEVELSKGDLTSGKPDEDLVGCGVLGGLRAGACGVGNLERLLAFLSGRLLWLPEAS